MSEELRNIELRLRVMEQERRMLAKHFDERLCDLVSRQDRTNQLLHALMVSMGFELKLEELELQALDRIEHPPVDSLGLHFDGVIEKPPTQMLGAKGVEGGKVNAASALPPDLERRLSVVGDPAFQRFCQTACDHGIDHGEHPVKQAARVILSICCVSTPYALVEPEPAERLNALLARFEAWRAANG